MYWTLVVFLGTASIVVEGFSNPDDCRFAGQTNIEYVQYGIKGVQYACAKSNKPPVICKKDTRDYGRTGECIT